MLLLLINDSISQVGFTCEEIVEPAWLEFLKNDTQ
jgi:hypothetical protein